MRFIVFLAMGAVAVGAPATCVACNGGVGGSGAPSSGLAGLSALRVGSGLNAGSAMASMGSSGFQQALFQQLANQRMLQQQTQQQLVARQQMSQGQTTAQFTSTRAGAAHQARETRLAQRQARAATIAARREAAKARNLVQSQVSASTGGTQLALDP